jgi:hypothetical protein
MAVSNTMVQTNVDTNKHEDFNLMFTNHGKEDGIYPPVMKKYPLKRNSKNTKQRSIIMIIVKNMQKHQKKDLHFQLIKDIIVL